MADESDLKRLPVDEVVTRVGIARAIGIKHVASLLLTYRCTIACDHCLFNCSPWQPDVCTSEADGIEFLRQLRATDRVIHIAGGEAMLYYERMLAICRTANEGGFTPHFFETNASWCTSEAVAYRRYRELKAAGLVGVLISADPYHQRFVSPERRFRAYRVAVELFGRENVIASDLTRDELRSLREASKDEARLAEHTHRHPPLLVGRAGETLTRFFPDRPIADLTGDSLWHGPVGDSQSCRVELDPKTMWEIHIDPYGNIQTCCGIVLGNARKTPLPELMSRGFHADNPLVRTAYDRGPYGLLELAVERGYRPLPGYKQKCHLCWETRKFLRPHFPETFGPAEIYETSRESRVARREKGRSLATRDSGLSTPGDT